METYLFKGILKLVRLYHTCLEYFSAKDGRNFYQVDDIRNFVVTARGSIPLDTVMYHRAGWQIFIHRFENAC